MFVAALGVIGCAVVFAVGETLLSPVMPALTNALATDELRGRYNAMTSILWGISGIVGGLLRPIPGDSAWRVTFVAPVFGATVNLIAREHGNEIWLEGRAPDNSLCRWTFSEITSERVRWQGFSSSDEGLTWTREEEMILHRRR